MIPCWVFFAVLAKAADATTVRSLYPYIAALAAQMSVPTAAIALCISLKEVAYMAAPLPASKDTREEGETLPTPGCCETRKDEKNTSRRIGETRLRSPHAPTLRPTSWSRLDSSMPSPRSRRLS